MIASCQRLPSGGSGIIPLDPLKRDHVKNVQRPAKRAQLEIAPP